MAIAEIGTPPRRARVVAFWKHAPLSFRIGTVLLLILLAVAATGPLWAPFGPAQMRAGAPLSGFSWPHLMGTDQLGRDVFSRIVYGAPIVLLLAISGTLLGAIAGAIIGLLSGYLSGWFDEFVMRGVEALISIPFLILALMIVAFAGPENSGQPLLVVFVIAFIYAPRMARLARAAALDIIKLDYVTAARLNGERPLAVVWREILPNAAGVILVEIALRASYAPVLVGALGFLGFGLRPPTPEWGLMIGEYRTYLLINPVMVVGPGIALATLVIGLNLWTDGLARIIGGSGRERNA
ncbi:MAG: ABC transporter permease [Parvibaculaceae bacterium]